MKVEEFHFNWHERERNRINYHHNKCLPSSSVGVCECVLVARTPARSSVTLRHLVEGTALQNVGYSES